MNKAQPPLQLRLGDKVQTLDELQLQGPNIHVIETTLGTGGIIPKGTEGVVTKPGTLVTIEFVVKGEMKADFRGINNMRSPSPSVKLAVRMADFSKFFRVKLDRIT